MKNKHRLSYQTLSGHQFSEASAIEVMAMEISNDILCAACSLGFSEDSLIGVSIAIVGIWRAFGVRFWAADTLDYVMRVLVLTNTELENENKDFAAMLGAWGASLFCLDRAVMHSRRHHGIAAANWFKCAQHLSNFQLSGSYSLQTLMAKTGAEAKLANDPKQKEKAIVFEWWQDWKKNPEKYKGKAAFARDMIKDLDHVKDVRTITDKWCPEWEDTHPAG